MKAFHCDLQPFGWTELNECVRVGCNRSVCLRSYPIWVIWMLSHTTLIGLFIFIIFILYCCSFSPSLLFNLIRLHRGHCEMNDIRDLNDSSEHCSLETVGSNRFLTAYYFSCYNTSLGCLTHLSFCSISNTVCVLACARVCKWVCMHACKSVSVHACLCLCFACSRIYKVYNMCKCEHPCNAEFGCASLRINMKSLKCFWSKTNKKWIYCKGHLPPEWLLNFSWNLPFPTTITNPHLTI